MLPKGAQVEAQYRGAWHGATVVASGEEGVQISWDYDGSLDEVEADQVREKGKAARCHWLRWERRIWHETAEDHGTRIEFRPKRGSKRRELSILETISNAFRLFSGAIASW